MTEWRTGKKIKPQSLFLNETWVEDALCAQTDPEIFHPDKGESAFLARSICRKCAVRLPCLDYALRHNVTGVWGGASENQRRQLKQERRRA